MSQLPQEIILEIFDFIPEYGFLVSKNLHKRSLVTGISIYCSTKRFLGIFCDNIEPNETNIVTGIMSIIRRSKSGDASDNISDYPEDRSDYSGEQQYIKEYISDSEGEKSEGDESDLDEDNRSSDSETTKSKKANEAIKTFSDDEYAALNKLYDLRGTIHSDYFDDHNMDSFEPYIDATKLLNKNAIKIIHDYLCSTNRYSTMFEYLKECMTNKVAEDDFDVVSIKNTYYALRDVWGSREIYGILDQIYTVMLAHHYGLPEFIDPDYTKNKIKEIAGDNLKRILETIIVGTGGLLRELTKKIFKELMPKICRRIFDDCNEKNSVYINFVDSDTLYKYMKELGSELLTFDHVSSFPKCCQKYIFNDAIPKDLENAPRDVVYDTIDNLKRYIRILTNELADSLANNEYH